MRKALIITIIGIIILITCKPVDTEKFDKETYTDNKFKDKNFLIIAQLQNERNTTELIKWLDNKNPAYREAAGIAFGSVQDTLAITNLFKLLETDQSIRVRSAAAFAIGQSGDSTSEARLLIYSLKEKSEKVKELVFEAIGKCGTKSGHEFLLEQLTNNPGRPNIGILSGLGRLSIRGIITEAGLIKMLDLIGDQTQNDENRFIASIYLSRIRGIDITGQAEMIIQAFQKTSHLFTRINLLMALSRAQTDKSLNLLKEIIDSDHDYRLKIAALRSISNYEYSIAKSLIIKSLTDSNIHVATQASEYFLSIGTKQDAETYFELAKKTKNWRVRVNLIAASIKFSPSTQKFSEYVRNAYQNTGHIYEKAGLIKALGGDISNFEFVNNELECTKFIPVSTAAIEALVDMRRSQEYNAFREKYNKSGKRNLDREFANLFHNSITSGDVAKVGIAAEFIRDTSFNFKELYKNISFLTEALNKCSLPAEIEIFRELKKTIAYFEGKEYVEEPHKSSIEPDWAFISKIPFKQNIEIETNKGKIKVNLLVNEAPVSVANFLKLIAENYFSNKSFHRVVPNFVIQDGCPRGDGWGGPEYTICSEFGMNYYSEGSLGMASSGKDTESSQWFITHSPTPHLDGRYTNFGIVTEGMDVVHQIEVGDIILGMKILP